MTGASNSADFPTVNAQQHSLGGGMCDSPPRLCLDAVVAKINRQGSNDDRGPGITMDRLGNVYLAGFTSSRDFPTLRPFQAAFRGGADAAFVIKIAR